MKNVAEFKKVPFKEWGRYISENNLFEEVGAVWRGEKAISLSHKEIKLPERSTKRSAGYDFFSPIDFVLNPHSSFCVPSGIRCKIFTEDFGLFLYPKSGLSRKYGIRLEDTVGVIDADYYDADNKGHILILLYNPSDEQVVFEAGDKLCQGVFQEYGLVVNDNVDNLSFRTGGFGSTGK